jgi:ferritin-like metal-binding protein YciE
MEEQLKDLYSAETQLLKMMPKIAKKISDETLRQAFEEHQQETEQQVERLEQIAQQLGIKPTGKVCNGMKGLLEEAKEALEEAEEGPVADLALVAAAQRVEHYEIAGYGNAKAIAEELGQQEIVDLLEQTLEEEKKADQRMTEECLQGIFDTAREQSEQQEGGSEEMSGEKSEEESSRARSAGNRRGGARPGSGSGRRAQSAGRSSSSKGGNRSRSGSGR